MPVRLLLEEGRRGGALHCTLKPFVFLWFSIGMLMPCMLLSCGGGGDGGNDEKSAAQNAGAGEGKPIDGNFGSITMTQNVLVVPDFEEAIELGDVRATFSKVRGGSDSAGSCTTTVIGACGVITCAASLGERVASGESIEVVAGKMTLQGLDLRIEMEIPEDSSTYWGAAEALMWEDSREVTASFTGDDEVPEFDISVETPDPITVTSAGSDGDVVRLSRDSGFDVTWTGGGVGSVIVFLSGRDGAEIVGVSCEADATEGQLTVDASVVRRLPDELGYSVTATTGTTLEVDDWSMSFAAAHIAVAAAATVTD